MQLASFPDFYQHVVEGIVLLAAVGFDINRKTGGQGKKVEKWIKQRGGLPPMLYPFLR
jgi:hypothetical protein